MIWPKVRWPSQRSSTCRPVPWSLIAPSGNRITRFSSVPPHRQPAANRGWRESSGGGMSGLLLFLFFDAKCARWGPPRLNVGEIQRVELCPQDVALIAQRLYGEVLPGSGLRILVDKCHGELSVFRRLRQTHLEIIQSASKPRIVLAKFLHAQRDQVAVKQLGQRRGHGFEQRAASHDVEIFIHSEACSGKGALSRANFFRVETGCFGKFQPTFNAAFAMDVAIVVDHTLAPGAPETRIRAARKDNRVFDRDDALVVVAVQGPGLQLSAAETPFMHHQVEWMLVVIAFLTHGPETGTQLVEGDQPIVARSRHRRRRVYSSNCHPSSAISQPASRTWRCCGLASSNMGFVLLMCR